MMKVVDYMNGKRAAFFPEEADELVAEIRNRLTHMENAGVELDFSEVVGIGPGFINRLQRQWAELRALADVNNNELTINYESYFYPDLLRFKFALSEKLRTDPHLADELHNALVCTLRDSANLNQ